MYTRAKLIKAQRLEDLAARSASGKEVDPFIALPRIPISVGKQCGIISLDVKYSKMLLLKLCRCFPKQVSVHCMANRVRALHLIRLMGS